MKKYKKIILVSILLAILLLISMTAYIYYNDEKEPNDLVDLEITTKKITSSKTIDTFFVDVKGSVKNPGVYEFNDNDRVIDAINKSGGLTTFANTSNINLSQKLSSEMVVYVYSNKEIREGSKVIDCSTKCVNNTFEVNNCTESKYTNDNLININEASKEILTTITGIGESKADLIIEYRETNGLFSSIEDIKNVSGIGDALFEKIKDKITV